MHDVFISYKSEDSAVACRVRDKLEANGIRCWIAERDISAGSNYAADIPAAIDSCKVLVLIFTQHAQNSPWIMKELDSAIAGQKLILPVKIGHFEISKTMSFLLTGVQYFDATTDPDYVLDRLVLRIRQAISTNEKGRHKKLEKIRIPHPGGCLSSLLIGGAVLAGLHYSGILDSIPHYREILQFLEELFTFFRGTVTELIAGL